MKINKKDIKSDIQELKNLIKEFNSNQKNIDVSNTPIGKVIEFIFRDFKLVIKKIGSNIFEVIENGESSKIKEGDFIMFNNPENIKVNEGIEFEIFRKALDYKSDPLKEIN